MCAQTCLWACARGRCGSPCAVELVASKYLRKQASRERDPPSLLRSPVEGVARSLSCHTRARDGSGDKRHARARVWWYRVRPRKWDSTLIHLTVPTGVSAPHSAHASQPPLTCPERARTPKPGRAGAQGVPQHRGATRGGIKTGGATHKAARTALSRPARPLQQRHFFCTLGEGFISSSLAAREIRRAGMLLEVAARGFAERRLVDGCRYASTGCSAGRSSTKPRTATSVLMLLRRS